MRRGYERERKGGPPLDVQRAAMKAAGIDITHPHAPIYTDLLVQPRVLPLARRALAIKSLRRGDELVVYDCAVLGADAEDIAEALAAITRVGASLVVCHPVQRSYKWHEDAAEMLSMAADAVRTLRTEKHRRAYNKGMSLGAPAKLVGAVLNAAREAWADPSLTAAQAADRVGEVTGTTVSARLLFDKLGKKSDAEAVITAPVHAMPVPKKPRRQKAKRKKKVTA